MTHYLPVLLSQVPRFQEPSPLYLPSHHSSNIPSQILIDPPTPFYKGTNPHQDECISTSEHSPLITLTVLFKPCESMTLQGTVAKKVTSLSHQGTLCLRVERDAGCLEIVARNVRTIVIYGLSVDLAKSDGFYMGLFRMWDSMANMRWATNLNKVGYLLA